MPTQVLLNDLRLGLPVLSDQFEEFSPLNDRLAESDDAYGSLISSLNLLLEPFPKQTCDEETSNDLDCVAFFVQKRILMQVLEYHRGLARKSVYLH